MMPKKVNYIRTSYDGGGEAKSHFIMSVPSRTVARSVGHPSRQTRPVLEAEAFLKAGNSFWWGRGSLAPEYPGKLGSRRLPLGFAIVVNCDLRCI